MKTADSVGVEWYVDVPTVHREEKLDIPALLRTETTSTTTVAVKVAARSQLLGNVVIVSCVELLVGVTVVFGKAGTSNC